MKLHFRHSFYGLAVLGTVAYGVATQDVDTMIKALAGELIGAAVWEAGHSAHARRRRLLPEVAPLTELPPDPVVSLTAGDTFTAEGADADGRRWNEAATVTEVADNMVTWRLRYCRRDGAVERDVRNFAVVTWTVEKTLIGHYVEEGGLKQRGAVHWIVRDTNTFESLCTYEEPAPDGSWHIAKHTYQMHRVQPVDARIGHRLALVAPTRPVLTSGEGRTDAVPVVTARESTDQITLTGLRPLLFADGTGATGGEIPRDNPDATGVTLPLGLAGRTTVAPEDDDGSDV